MDLFSRLDPHAPKALAGLRIVAGLMFMQHGTQKSSASPPRRVGRSNSSARWASAGFWNWWAAR